MKNKAFWLDACLATHGREIEVQVTHGDKLTREMSVAEYTIFEKGADYGNNT